MKLKAHKVEKLPGGNVAVRAVWTNQMRVPKTLAIVAEESPTGALETLTEGDAGDVFNTLSGMAEIAWNMGWRPAGLANTVAGVVAAYRLPAGS